MGRRDSQGVWDGHVHTLLQIKMDKQQVPTVIAQGTLLGVIWQPRWEGSLEENGYVWLSPFAAHLKLS